MIYNPELAVGFAEGLIQAHKARGGNVDALFAAFVGVVSERDKAVGLDCLIALDRFISGPASE